jgi:hypothetical protein
MEHREDPCSKLNLQLFQNHKCCHHFCDVIVIISSFLSKNHFEGYFIFFKELHVNMIFTTIGIRCNGFDFKMMDFY